jgi:beta-phosphoglucomutase
VAAATLSLRQLIIESVTLKTILFDFNGVIINDESIHRAALDEILLSENLPPQGREFWQISVGKTDRSCLQMLLEKRGRFVSGEYLDKLLTKKAATYRQKLNELAALPIYPDAIECLEKLRDLGYQIGLVTGAIRAEVEYILEQAQLRDYFGAIVTGDEVSQSKPSPEGYLKAFDRIAAMLPDLGLEPQECLAIEDTFPGIAAARAAGMQVVAISHTYPLHMLQRHAHWAIDSFADLELERIIERFDRSRVHF